MWSSLRNLMYRPVRDLRCAYKRNVLLETCITAFALGFLAMAGVTLMVHAYWFSGSAAEYAVGMNLVVVHVIFHFSEFAVAAAQRPMETHPEAFMIFHSWAYVTANTISILEFVLGLYLIPESWKPFRDPGSVGHLLFRLNMPATTVYGLLALFFYALRMAATVQAGDSFSLIIQFERRPEHTLMTTGLYSRLRHPAYFGWFWRTPFAQLMLANPVSAVAHTTVTWFFFKGRIPYEENLMLKAAFFGEEYRAYKRRTIIGIPFITT